MSVATLVGNYEKNIMKLAEKNGIEFELMLDNWKQKYEIFDSITDDAGLMEEFEEFDKDNDMPLVALTVNGSIIIASKPDEMGSRKVRYLSIKLRNDESKNVPEVFNGKLTKNVHVGDAATFDVMASSGVIAMKGADDFEFEEFEEKAEEITDQVTKVFEQLDDEMITKQLEFADD
ncbi:MAG: hypothetical protein MJB14_11995 [Spirochaetes bacterium]|nr:hypothetical protein [Spirochaetota bacterium]